MTNPYIQTLIEMGYDKQDVQVASTMFQKKTFPCVIHGRQFDTEEQYYAELHDFMNGMWLWFYTLQPYRLALQFYYLTSFLVNYDENHHSNLQHQDWI